MTASQRQQQITEFLTAHGFEGATLLPLAGDASFRRYIRIRKNGKPAMLMDAPPDKENTAAFLAIAEHLLSHGYSAPAIMAHDVASGLMLLEDMGDDSFTAVLRRQPETERELYQAAIDLLAKWHTKQPPLADAAQLALPRYDHHALMREAQLFADWYLPQAVGKEKAAALGTEYMGLWARLLSSAPLAATHFVHRDYHADNLLWLPGREENRRVGVLDFQDALYGDPAYDVVSLLEDARRDVPEALAGEMLARYLGATGIPRQQFDLAYHVLGAQRNSKIVGIFARLAARDGKYQYLNYLPRVWKHLERDVAHPALEDMKRWLDKHIDPAARGTIAIRHTSQELARTA